MPASKFEDNPTEPKEFDKLRDDKRRFTVQHTGVGRSQKSDTVGLHDLGPGAQVTRLVELGALAPTEDATDTQATDTETEDTSPSEDQKAVLEAAANYQSQRKAEEKKAADEDDNDRKTPPLSGHRKAT